MLLFLVKKTVKMELFCTSKSIHKNRKYMKKRFLLYRAPPLWVKKSTIFFPFFNDSLPFSDSILYIFLRLSYKTANMPKKSCIKYSWAFFQTFNMLTRLPNQADNWIGAKFCKFWSLFLKNCPKNEYIKGNSNLRNLTDIQYTYSA